MLSSSSGRRPRGLSSSSTYTNANVASNRRLSESRPPTSTGGGDCPVLSSKLERAEQTVPDRGADAEVHDLSMVMEVMEALESSPVGDAHDALAAMVLLVVHEGEIVVAGIEPED